jgi:hypothetical protein
VTALTKSLLEIPVGTKSLPLFKGMMKSKQYQQVLEKICKEELDLLDERMSNGDTAAAVAAFFESRQKKHSSKL